MAKLKAFKRDSRYQTTGEWVQIGEEYDDLEILTRGFTDSYTDKRSAMFRKTALKYRGDVSKVTTAEGRDITIECLISECLLDVRNLLDEAGQPVTFAAFCGNLRDPDYADLYTATLMACGMVGRARAADADADVKN